MEVLRQFTEILELLLVPLLSIELIWLYRRGELHRDRLKEMATNVMSFLFVIAGAALGVTLWYALFDRISDALPYSIAATPLSLFAAVVFADFLYYWEHRLEHERRLLWDLYHSVHHSSERFDQTTNLRLGFFDGLLTIGFSLPLILVGFSPAVTIVATGLTVGYQTWIHTEWIQKMPRWFEAIFNTPSHHRAHHGADEHYLDVNYAAIFIIWDRLFGTFQAETSRPNYGLTTQIDSAHPLDVQFSQLRLLWRDLRADHSWSDRLRRLWNHPGWQPQQLPRPASLPRSGSHSSR